MERKMNEYDELKKELDQLKKLNKLKILYLTFD